MNNFTKTLFVAASLAVPALAPTLAAAQACPSYAESGAALSYTSDDVWTPQTHAVVAGGNLDLAQCGSVPGVGHVIESPDFTLQYDAQTHNRALEFRVTGTCDTVLLVNSASGEWGFSDDDTDANPRLRLEGAPSGQYDIWVGTFDAATCDATLTIESW